VDRFTWNPEWDTGFPSIDEQHRRLLAEFHDFLEAVHHHFHREHIRNLLEFLADFLESHFEDEELRMRATGYPRFQEHKAFHDGMRARIQTLMAASLEDPEAGAEEAAALVRDWMEDHIKVEDRLMARHLIQFSPKGSAPES
jgi:hemerythrin